MNKENTFKVIDREGKEIEFEILFTFESDETKRIIWYIQIIPKMKKEIPKYTHQYLNQMLSHLSYYQ